MDTKWTHPLPQKNLKQEEERFYRGTSIGSIASSHTQFLLFFCRFLGLIHTQCNRGGAGAESTPMVLELVRVTCDPWSDNSGGRG